MGLSDGRAYHFIALILLAGASTGPRLRRGSFRLKANGLPVEKQTWAVRQIEEDGSAQDATLDWAELRRCVSGSDARLLLRTSALDLAMREKFVVFDLGVLKGYVDRGRAVLLYPAAEDDGARVAVPGMPAAAKPLAPSREHCSRVEMHINDALARPGGRRLSFAMIVLECVLEEVRIILRVRCSGDASCRHTLMQWRSLLDLNKL